MRQQKGRSTLLLTVLVTSIALLVWSVLSTWRQAEMPSESQTASTTQSPIQSQGEALPPALEAKGAKASLFYPVLKGRGPQPGSNLVSKPLIPTYRGPAIDAK